MNDDDDESMGDVWRAIKAQRQVKRADNRASSADLLRAAGIPFVPKNGGAHLIVTTSKHTVDFWPGTGLWVVRGSTQQRRGVMKLIALATGPSV